MHAEPLAFLQRARTQYPWLFQQARVLECGALDINGSARGLFRDCDYTGLDWRAGPGVDTVALAHEYESEQPFDVVYSTEMLEHDPYWRASVANMARNLASGGLLMLTWAAPGRRAHETACAPVDEYYKGPPLNEVLSMVERFGPWHALEARTVRRGLDCQLLAMRPLTSVVIGTLGQPALLNCCIQELRRTATRPLEIVVVDNGSTPAEQARIREFDIDVLLQADEPLGYAAANNAGIAATHGKYVLLCNNDAWPTRKGWDARLISIFENVPGAMLVSPTAPRVYHPEQHADGPQKEDCQLVQVDQLSFVAPMLRRATLDAIGPLDERFGVGNFEDDDYCRRITQAGGQILIDPATYFFHVGSVTLSTYDYPALLERNRKLYEEKWNAEDQPA